MSVEDRLAELERKNQNLTVAVGAVGTVGAVAMLGLLALVGGAAREAGSEPQECVTAQNFALMDQSGKPRGHWQTTADGPKLTLMDETGKTRVGFSGDDNPSLVIQDKNGKPRISLSLIENETAVHLWDEKQNCFAVLSEGEGSGGVFDISNALGKVVVSIQADKTNRGLVTVHDQNGEMVRVLSAQ